MAVLAKANKDGYVQMHSHQAGECAWCGKRWPKGKVIWWHPVWKIAICCPQHQIRKHMETFASKRRRQMASSTAMRRQGGTTV